MPAPAYPRMKPVLWKRLAYQYGRGSQTRSGQAASAGLGGLPIYRACILVSSPLRCGLPVRSRICEHLRHRGLFGLGGRLNALFRCGGEVRRQGIA